MDLQSQILLRHDKQNMILIREYVGDDPQRFANLMKLFFSDQYRIQQRTSWAVMHCVTRQPTLITPYLEKMINLLDRSDEHTSELHSLMRHSYAVFCFKKTKNISIFVPHLTPHNSNMLRHLYITLHYNHLK